MSLIVDFITREFHRDRREVPHTSIVWGDVLVDIALSLPWWPGLQEPGLVTEYTCIFHPRPAQAIGDA
eukprot:263232-Amphidinium_carterae.1